MLSINFYLDSKADKNKQYPIHLVMREKDEQIKVSTGEKISKEFWDTEQQAVKDTEQADCTNKYLTFLKQEVEKIVDGPGKEHLTAKRLKEQIKELVEARRNNNDAVLQKDTDQYLIGKEAITVIDLFAGAGGFSEGFLQAEHGNKLYDFLLASDINENCELTHLARYNHQLGLPAAFLRQDITEPDFLENMFAKLNGKQVDVVCGGPPCQSFSLAGKRKKFDKKDDLFGHYLEVIKQLRPKYFVMENVKGILTKEKGKIKEMILQDIRSIIDLEEFPTLIAFINEMKKRDKLNGFILECYNLRLHFEKELDQELEDLKQQYILNIEKKFKDFTAKAFEYKKSKTDPSINTIRHGFNLLKRTKELKYIRKKVINEKAFCNLDEDDFTAYFDDFLTAIEPDAIIATIENAFHKLSVPKDSYDKVVEIIRALEIYNSSFDECVAGLDNLIIGENQKAEFAIILSRIRLYNIEEPFLALASNYGVPQNRERVLFIGCRKDQVEIKDVPATVSGGNKVNIFEALHDLDFIGNNQEKFSYESVDLKTGQAKKLVNLIKKRAIDGKIDSKGFSYAEWSRKGRLNGRFASAKSPFYVRNFEELGEVKAQLVAPLHNHKTSNQNLQVIEKLQVILTEGNYDTAKVELREKGLDSDKRNYNVLKAHEQSPTVVTIPDDYIHFSKPRALTVREMARLQSFDDSFVFQGKRSTGGDKRKTEVPQYTLVGNAVPPLMARAVAMEILKNIK